MLFGVLVNSVKLFFKLQNDFCEMQSFNVYCVLVNSITTRRPVFIIFYVYIYIVCKLNK